MTKEQIDDLKTKGLIQVMQNEIRNLLWQAHNRLDDARKLDDVDTLDRETIYTTYDGSQNQMPCSNRLKDAIKMYRQKELDNLTVEHNGNVFQADEVSQDRLIKYGIKFTSPLRN